MAADASPASFPSSRERPLSVDMEVPPRMLSILAVLSSIFSVLVGFKGYFLSSLGCFFNFLWGILVKSANGKNEASGKIGRLWEERN